MAIEIKPDSQGRQTTECDGRVWVEETLDHWVLRDDGAREVATVRIDRARNQLPQMTWRVTGIASPTRAPNLAEAIRQATFNATRVGPVMRDAAGVDREQMARTRAALDWVDADGD